MLIEYLFSDPVIFFSLVFAMLVSLALHEFSHAWTATSLGDDTPGHAGRLTINPLNHIDPIGFLLFLFIGFGWGKPVPFNPENLRNRKYGPALVGLAGPLANLALAVVFGILLRIILATTSVSFDNLGIQFFTYVVIINVVWMIFNLIPIPPLDGSKVLFALIPESLSSIRVSLERYGPMLLLLLIVLDRFSGLSVFSSLFSNVIGFVSSLILGSP